MRISKIFKNAICTLVLVFFAAPSVFAAALPTDPASDLPVSVHSELALEETFTSTSLEKSAKGFAENGSGVRNMGEAFFSGLAEKVLPSGPEDGQNKEGLPLYSPGRHTIKNLLATALQPCGRTMYIWGGGWDESEGRFRVSEEWVRFFEEQTTDYDFDDHRLQNEERWPDPAKIHLGLDCSGFVGWVVQNTLDRPGPGAVRYAGSSYMTFARLMAKNFEDRGWGTYTPKEEVRNYKPGDVLSSQEHVVLVVGQCEDGSVLYLHSGLPGVYLCASRNLRDNAWSQAERLAVKYMKKYFPAWHEKFPGYRGKLAYTSEANQFRWGEEFLADPEGYRSMAVEEILRDLFGEV